MKKGKLLTLLLAGFVLLVIFLVFLWRWQQSKNVSVIDHDTTIAGDFSVDAGKTLLLKNGAKLTVEGNLRIQGEMDCEGGSLRVVGKKNVDLNGSIRCGSVAKARREAELESESVASEVGMVVHGSLAMNTGSVIESSGSVQIVGSEEQLAEGAKLDERYNDAAKETGKGIRVGPMTEEGGVQAAVSGKPLLDARGKLLAISNTEVTKENSGTLEIQKFQTNAEHSSQFVLIPAAEAQAPLTAVLSGRIVIGTPRKGVHQIVVVDLPDVSNLTVQDLEIDGPDGRWGEDDLQKNCNAVGKDGEDAFRFLAIAPNLTVQNFTLKLGNGGDGGNAETRRDCDPGTAQGGRGGKSGNFKMIAGEKFDITGTFTIIPGSGGNGGSAKAYGKNAVGPFTKGGDASATGGRGADNTKKLSVGGTIDGMTNMQFGSSIGGNGGDAYANAGRGGDGKGCGSNGGAGGNATTIGGRGGDDSLSLAPGSKRSAGAEDNGGDGGKVTSLGGHGGDGGDCGPDGPGGAGGKGGDAKSALGSGGVGTSHKGNDGTKVNENGGDGGDGGDGCPPGGGGLGGSGNPVGKNGHPGADVCKKPTPSSGVAVTDTPRPTEAIVTDEPSSFPCPNPTKPCRSTSPSQTPTPTEKPTSTPTNVPLYIPLEMTPTPTETIAPRATPTPTPAKEQIPVIQYGNSYIPTSQLHVGKPEPITRTSGCSDDHWHPNNGSATTVDGKTVSDPNPTGCGFCTVAQCPVVSYTVQ